MGRIGRRSEIVPPKEKLRTLILKNGGIMSIIEVLRCREFHYGYDENDIRQYVYQLRKDNK
jgi:hypothetical protein